MFVNIYNTVDKPKYNKNNNITIVTIFNIFLLSLGISYLCLYTRSSLSIYIIYMNLLLITKIILYNKIND